MISCKRDQDACKQRFKATETHINTLQITDFNHTTELELEDGHKTGIGHSTPYIYTGMVSTL